jgi:hypothetical protein
VEPELAEAAEPADAIQPDLAEAEEPTAAVEPQVAEAEEPTAAAEPDLAEAEEPTAAVEPQVAEAEEPTAAAEPDPAEAEEPITEDVEAEEAVAAFEEDDSDKTQIIRVPASAGDDRTAGPGETTRDVDFGVTTRVIGPGERTQVIHQRDVEEAAAHARAAQAEQDRLAQERARQAFRDRAAQERARQAFAERAAYAAREVGEDTAVIHLGRFRGGPDDGELTQVVPPVHGPERAPSATAAGDDEGDRTQVLPPIGDDGDRTEVLRSAGRNAGAGTVEPPGDQTQVLRFPAPRTPGDDTTAGNRLRESTTAGTDRSGEPVAGNDPAGPSSIVEHERPDPGDDPTTRLSPLVLGEDETPTADLPHGPRPKSFLDLERPADEAADDTTRLVPVQRVPEDDDAEAPTHRV